ncbi:MAG: isoprenyl transferase [Planctomycetota bacterium]|nr:isoprenyl transferase [Planctomycetota bacterium]MDA1138765.1 isoprenyl transferase [Planctomycetota bacterium]
MDLDIPRHIAIIMDGNGRWAESRRQSRIRGHEQGAESVRAITRECARLGVEQLTLYAFSNENWKRPRAEVSFLMRLYQRYLIKERKEIMDNNIRFINIGRTEVLPGYVQKELQKTIAMSAENTGMLMCVAINYGGRVEIMDAAKRFAAEVKAGTHEVDDLDEELFAKYLYQPSMRDPDLLIRTADEMRISNFLLWQLSYSEIWVSPICWPEFREEHLMKGIEAYNQRIRKFGALKT